MVTSVNLVRIDGNALDEDAIPVVEIKKIASHLICELEYV
jgi:hypothetical protein